MNHTYLVGDIFTTMIDYRVLIKKHKYMGLGWQLYTNLDSLGLCNFAPGSDKGANARVFPLPGTGKGAILLTNANNGPKLYK